MECAARIGRKSLFAPGAHLSAISGVQWVKVRILFCAMGQSAVFGKALWAIAPKQFHSVEIYTQQYLKAIIIQKMVYIPPSTWKVSLQLENKVYHPLKNISKLAISFKLTVG